MKKAFRIIAILFVALIFLGTFAFLYQKSLPQEVRYNISIVDTTDIVQTTIVTGTIEPRDEVLIKPQISGIIAELYKKAGDKVKEGEIIAKVKVIPEMASLNAAENRVRIAEMNAVQARTDLSRIEQLYNEGLVSAEEYEKSRLSTRQAEEELRTATDALQIVKEGVSAGNASYSTTLIRSTITGLILDIPVKVGNSVIQSNTFNDGTTIAAVADMNDLIFKGSIDETEVARLSEGMHMNITVGALPNQKFNAILEFIAPKVSTDASSANRFEIKAAVSIPDSIYIRAGYSANAEIALQSLQEVLALPEGCITYQGDSTFVYVLTSENPQAFERKVVTTGISDGVKIQICSGVEQGEKVRENKMQDISL